MILIFSEDGTKHELTTDKKGRWKKANMRSGAWTIGIMAEEYEIAVNRTYQYLAEIYVNPGHYIISVAVKNVPSSVISYLQLGKMIEK